jgi:hypothetical protein
MSERLYFFACSGARANYQWHNPGPLRSPHRSSSIPINRGLPAPWRVAADPPGALGNPGRRTKGGHGVVRIALVPRGVLLVVGDTGNGRCGLGPHALTVAPRRPRGALPHNHEEVRPMG